MMKRSWLAPVLALAISGAAFADEAKSKEVPYPSRELQKLSSFVGTWHMTGEMLKSPMGPGGKMEATEHCSWYAGNYFLTCHVEGNGPMGKSTGMEIFGYDAQK